MGYVKPAIHAKDTICRKQDGRRILTYKKENLEKNTKDKKKHTVTARNQDISCENADTESRTKHKPHILRKTSKATQRRMESDSNKTTPMPQTNPTQLQPNLYSRDTTKYSTPHQQTSNKRKVT
ncbi:unnamed protein product [Clavelina lepadiformis]|uniref:Uncharacterized protein n=1 Tax=Clavelina lepadiformis TaxID=159417 RepID=A0ABP0GDU1_CLALP